MTEKLVVIGNGMASGRMLEHLFEEAPGRYDITLFNAEPRGNYNRIMLSPVLVGREDLRGDRHPRRRLVRRERHHARFGEHGRRRSTARAQVVTSEGRRDALRQAADRHRLGAVHHPGAGQGPAGRHRLPRPRRRRRMMLARPQPRRKAVVIGGGLLGLEAAAGLRLRGMEVTVCT